MTGEADRAQRDPFGLVPVPERAQDQHPVGATATVDAQHRPLGSFSRFAMQVVRRPVGTVHALDATGRALCTGEPMARADGWWSDPWDLRCPGCAAVTAAVTTAGRG